MILCVSNNSYKIISAHLRENTNSKKKKKKKKKRIAHKLDNGNILCKHKCKNEKQNDENNEILA